MSSHSFSSINEQISSLKDTIGRIAVALDKKQQVLDEPGWHDINSIPVQFCLYRDKPILVLCLSGPSGGGKSTIFKLLTGIDVPSGSAVRPVSYNTVIAVPSQLRDTSIPQELLPTYEKLEPLHEPDQVRDKHMPATTALVSAYAVTDESPVLSLIADIPDFNTVETSNWEKAEKMMARADLVLFVTQTDNYMDKDVVTVLHRCCKYAGKLAYIITKVAGESQEAVCKNATEIWQSMTGKASDELQSFSESRADGTPLSDFLRKSEVFFAPFSNKPVIDDFRSLDGSGKSLASIAMGLDAENILIERLRQVAKGGLELGRSLCQEAGRLQQDLEEQITRTEQLGDDLSQRIAYTQFPAGQFLSILIDTIRDSRPNWIKVVAVPISAVGKAIEFACQGLGSVIRKLRRQGIPPEIRKQANLEQDRLETGIEALIDKLRSKFPEYTKGRLSNANTGKLKAHFLNLPLPPMDQSKWESFIRSHAEAWAHANPWKTTIIGSLSDMLVLIGGSLFVVDLATSGGSGAWLLVALDTIGPFAGGSAIIGVLLKIVEEFNMGFTLNEVNAQWSKQRGGEFKQHIMEGFATPLLLGELRSRRQAIQTAPLEECRAMCSELSDRLKLEHRHE